MTEICVVEPDRAIAELLRSATGDVVIAAPYIKAKPLQQLISLIPDNISKLTCITRWLPEDIASGVCDLEIFDIIGNRSEGILRLYPHLHAKYFRTSTQVLIGSANITARALGWFSPSNLELLVQLPIDILGLAEWENRLLGSTIPATTELRDQLAKEAQLLKAAGAGAHVPEVESISQELDPLIPWFPECPAPERLWEVYKGEGIDTMVRSAREGAERDLVALAPPKGFSKDLFEAFVAGILKQMSIVRSIDELSSYGLSDSQAIAFLSETLGNNIVYTHDKAWLIFKRWLTYFFPTDYRLETAQEVLIKGKKISR